ncbi:hypothetical protein CFE70_000710 [Pyrenophora teres f. teres 0-1]
MAEWAQTLKQDHEYESDEIIPHLISLRQIDDQIQDALFTADAKRLPLSDAGTLMHVKFMEAQLDSWKKNIVGVRSQRLIMTVAKLCMPSDAHLASRWDVQTAQDRVRLDLCLESLCYPASYDRPAGIDYMGDINMDIAAENNNGNDSFAFLKDMDFDMEQFFDMDGGIWGDESYNTYSAMGLGDRAPF